MSVVELARTYHQAVHAASSSDVAADPEAQLTQPVAQLLAAICRLHGLGELHAIRESHRDSIKPDFAFLLDRRFIGYGELKKPGLSIDLATGRGWTAGQKEHLQEIEALLCCNGREVRLYQEGVLVAEADLPYDDPESWNSANLEHLLATLADLRPRHVTSVSDLAVRLARRTAGLRDRIMDLLENVPPTPASAVSEAINAYDAWRKLIHPSAKYKDFADGVAQVLAYGLVMVALRDRTKSELEGALTAKAAREELREDNPVIAASFGPLLESPAMAKACEAQVAALEDLCNAIDPVRVERSSDRRGEPWLYFYEDFLAVYDPAERKQAGVYYTPTDVVRAMVRLADHLLVERLGKRLGFASGDVMTLDPATGTGTFPLAVINSAVGRAEFERSTAGPAQAGRTLLENLIAFELLPGPYGVAHLRIAQRLRGLDATLTGQPKVVLTDTLESPVPLPGEQYPLFGDPKALADEQKRARKIKSDQRVTVVIGNPPYRRIDKKGSGRGGGGWVLKGDVPGRPAGKSLFDDILDVAKAHTIFSHHASLYNLYVYFWRWSLWKAFEAHGDGPGIVALITGNSWLDGPGFMGLRQLVREVADEGWVIDLGGDNKGAVADQNIFAIETPVAVVILVRDGATDRTRPATMHYRKIEGDRAGKLAQLAAIAETAAHADAQDPFAGEWTPVPNGWREPLVPPTGDAAWMAMPALTDLMPWQQPGCKFNRLWPIAVDAESLERRWRRFVSSPTEPERKAQLERGQSPDAARETLFQTANSGRSIYTAVGTLPRLADLRADAAHRPIVRYGYRSFDRQYAFSDPRMAKTDSPALWQAISKSQVFLATMTSDPLGPGPAVVSSSAVPDLHYFCGRGGKDILPLYRDADCQAPNVTQGLLATLATEISIPLPTPEDLAAYIYAMLATPHYQQRFAVELGTAGPRVPITARADLWQEAVTIGRRLIWLHTYAERFRDPADGRGPQVPKVKGLGWSVQVHTMPDSGDQIRYEPETSQLHVGDGVITGVRSDVWTFSVSGMQVVAKWLGYRTRRGAGRAASSPNPLDKERPTKWVDEWNDELLDLLRVLTLTVEGWPGQAALIDRICEGPLLAASELPAPTPESRKPPVTEAQES